MLKGSVLSPNIQSPIMPKATTKSAHGNNNLSQDEIGVPSSPEDTASSDQEIHQELDPEVSFLLSREQQAIPNMFMPFIEGPEMD